MSISEFRTWLTSHENDAEVRAFQRTYGVFGDLERRTFKHRAQETRKAGTSNTGRNDGSLQVVGHAAVFGEPSVEMMSPFGAFTEYIDARAFDNVLQKNPDVLLTWDHDTRYVLGRTANNTLDLTVDGVGLRYWSRVADTSYARDLQVLMEGGYLDQSSFLFRIAPGGEEWRTRELDDGTTLVERTIFEVGGLFDVCVCAAGAYPQTDSGLARNLALDYATSRGFIAVPRTIINPETQTTDEARAIGDIAWGPEDGVNDLECDIEAALNGDDMDCCYRYSVVDVAVDMTKVMICDWDDYTYWVAPITIDSDNEPVVSDRSEWVQVDTAWVTTAEGYEANIRSAKMRREARMAEGTETETPVEAETTVTEPAVESTEETVEATETAEVAAETTETETESETPETESEAEVSETRTDAAVTRLLAEARARLARAKTV